MSVSCSIVVICWERADLSALLYVISCVLSISHTVTWVRCGTLLLRTLCLLNYFNQDISVAFPGRRVVLK